MGMLHPTLWRTCRVLAGPTRLSLFRRVVAIPDQTVTGLANAVGISVPRASQELRRLQSRGLIQASRQDLFVRYRPVADALVSSAGPLLRAMCETFEAYPESEDADIVRIATGFSHTRRLVIMRWLAVEPRKVSSLDPQAGMSRDALDRHLKKLQAAGFVRRRKGVVRAVENPRHPLARGLLDLIRAAGPP